MAAMRGRRSVQRQLYVEVDNEDEDEEETGKLFKQVVFVYIESMSVKQVTDQNVFYFSTEA